MWRAELYKINGSFLADATGKTLANAVLNAKRKAGVATRYGSIGLIERFLGGCTYHVQFGRNRRDETGTNLSDKYVVHAWEE